MNLSGLSELLVIARDVGIVVGIPTMIAIWLKQIKARDDANAATIRYLEATQFPKARAQLEEQKLYYEGELAKLQEQLEESLKANSEDSATNESLQSRIDSLRKGISTLATLKATLTSGIESEALHKFEGFCRDLDDPNKPVPDYLFISVSYGNGITPAAVDVLVQKDLIKIEAGSVSLTKKGKEIWKAIQR